MNNKTRRISRKELVERYYNQQKTMQSIGEEYGVCRERVRQWMERENLPRVKKGRSHKSPAPKYKSLEEYFAMVKETGKESKHILIKFINPLRSNCEECNSTTNLHIHHKKYPATSLKDIQILCCSCHFCKHRKGNGHKIQLEICNKYIKGLSAPHLAEEYNMTKGMIYHILRKWNIKKRAKKK